MKKSVTFYTIFFLLFLGCFNCYSQRRDEVSNKYWDMLIDKSYKLNASKKYMPYFPPSLMALNNTKIELNGYMIPIKSGLLHDNFLLSVLPVLQCQFCGMGDVPEMVIVFTKDKIKFTDKPILLEGTLKIDEYNMDNASYTLSNAAIKNQ